MPQIICGLFFIALLMPLYLKSSEVKKPKASSLFAETQKRREEDAERFKRIATALGGKALDHKNEATTVSSHSSLPKEPENQKAKL